MFSGIVEWFRSYCGGGKSEELLNAESCFSEQELQDVHDAYGLIALHQFGHGLGKAGLLELCSLTNLSDILAVGLYKATLSPDAQDPGVSIHDVIIAKARCERMGEAASEEVAFAIMDPERTGLVPRPRLVAVLRAVLALAVAACGQGSAPEPSVVQAVADGMLGCSKGNEKGLTLAGFKTWNKTSPGVKQVLTSLLSRVGQHRVSAGSSAAAGPSELQPSPSHPSVQVPVVQLGSVPWSQCLLRPEWLWLLASALAPELRQEWRLLFSSAQHGMSYSTLIGKLGQAAPTMLLIQDKEGHLLGGVATQPWQQRGTFYGDSGTFVFGLLPKFGMYHSTGMNSNYQYCGINFSQIPNGIGIGGLIQGKSGFHAVWLDSTLDTGISRRVSTFANPSFSHHETFQVAAVECWQLKPPEDDQQQVAGGSLVLDKHKEDQQLLELAGVNVRHSQGYREPLPPSEQ